MPRVQKVSSTAFASRFGQWAFTAQSAPVMVTNQKTGMVLGFFVSAGDFEHYLRVRDLIPKARFAWEMPDELAAELDTPLGGLRAELDTLIDE